MSENVPFNDKDPHSWTGSALSQADITVLSDYFVRTSHDFIAVLTNDQNLVYLNPALEQAILKRNAGLPDSGLGLASIILSVDKHYLWNKAIQNCISGREISEIIECPLLDGQTTRIIFKPLQGKTEKNGHLLIHILKPVVGEANLTARDNNFRQLFYENPQPMWIFDTETLNIMEVNNAAIQKYGYSKDEFLRLNLKDLRSEEDLPYLYHILNNFTDSFKNVGVVRHLTKEGKIIYVEVTGHRMEFNRRPSMHILINDVTEKVISENHLKKQATIRERLFKLFSEASEMDEEQLFKHFLDLGMEMSDSHTGFLVYASSEYPDIHTAIIHDHYSKEEVRTFKLSKTDQIIFRNCFSGHAEIINHTPSGNWASWMEEYQIKVSNMICVPVSDGSDPEIFIGLGNRSKEYTNDDLEELKAVTSEFIKIVSKRKVDLALVKMEERWHFAVEGNNDGLWDWNLTTGEIFFSKSWKEMLGYEDSDIPPNYEAWENLLHPEDADNAKEQLQKYISGEVERFNSEYRARCKDGSWKWILDRGKIIEYSSDGKAARMIGTHKDITDRKTKELTIRTLNEKLTLANKAARIGIWEWDPASRQHTWDENMYFLYGLTNREIEISTDILIELVLPEDRHKVFAYYNLLLHENNGNELIFRIRKPDGAVRHLKSFGKTEYDHNGNLIKVIGVNYDITEIVHQEEIIRQNENIFQAAFDHSTIGMSLTSLEGRYFKVNSALCRILGYEDHELVAKSFRDISVPDDLGQNLVYFEEARKGERDTYEMEKRYYHKSGKIIWVYLNVSTVKDDDGKPVFFVSQIQDITLRKTAEASLRLSEERLRLAVESANLGLFDINLKDQIFEINYSNKNQLFAGIKSGKNTSEFYQALIHPEDLKKAYEIYYQYVNGEINIYSCELRMRSSDSGWRWLHTLGNIVTRDESGNPLRMVGTIMDITERKMNEEKIKDHLHELQRWHEATLGRENRIMELKKEVNILLQEAAKPPKYFSVL